MEQLARFQAEWLGRFNRRRRGMRPVRRWSWTQAVLSDRAGVQPCCCQGLLGAGGRQWVQRAGGFSPRKHDGANPRPGGADPERWPDCGAPYPL